MADETKKKGGEGEKPEKAPKPEKPQKEAKAEGGERAPKGEKPQKGEQKGGQKGDKGGKGDQKQAQGKKGKEEAKPVEKAPPPRLRIQYHKEIAQKLREQFKYANPMEIPKLVKITLNMGLGEAIENVKILDTAAEELASIAGQKPVITKAKKSIANFKLRAGMPIGVMVTLRRDTMYEFFDRLVNVALPRVRDFKGVSTKAFDGKGNYSLGLKEQIIFPEINYDKVDKIKGMNITIVTTAKTDEEGRALLAFLGMPFRK
jgi:large subunit ribosomal protein L5